jgi:carbon-monoxide dehydrogenase medium subunit
MVLPRFDYVAPATVAEAVAHLAAANGEARVLAGGTDLLVRMKRRVACPRLLVSLRNIEGLTGVTTTAEGGVHLGALTTMAATAEHPALTERWWALAEGAAAVGGPIIRNRATVGGNVVNARPCADTVPALIALGARLHLQGRRCRSVDLDGFILGPGQTAIAADEILTSIELPAAAAPFCGSCYLKMTRRAAMEVTIVGCAVRLDLEADRRTVKAARLVFASVAPVPLRARAAEQLVQGCAASTTVFREAARVASAEARPIDDCRAPADFRTQMVEVLTRRALQVALDRAVGRNAP